MSKMQIDLFPSVVLFFIVLVIGGFIVSLILAFAIGNDAEKHGENGLLWGLIVLVTPLLGILAYLLVRSSWQRPVSQPMYNAQYPGEYTPAPSQQIIYCTNCGADNIYNSRFCKNCGNQLF
ncbi:MAG: hypothetical protein ACFFBD_29950 [Candidatus Hodarchaeota archaeon]